MESKKSTTPQDDRSIFDFLKRATGWLHRRVQTVSIQRILRKRGLAKARKIPTFTVRAELETLFQLAHACPTGARVLEVGSYLGASTCYLASGLRDSNASITCIDTWQNQTMPDGTRDTLAEFEKNLRPIRPQLILIRKTSSEINVEEIGGTFDLIFLDGDHSYLQTKSDFEKFSDLLAEDGTLAFHDSLYFEGVSRVVGEALASARWQIGGNVKNLFWIHRAGFPHRS